MYVCILYFHFICVLFYNRLEKVEVEAKAKEEVALQVHTYIILQIK